MNNTRYNDFFHALQGDCYRIVSKIINNDYENQNKDINIVIDKKVTFYEDDLPGVDATIRIEYTDNNEEIETFNIFSYGDGGLCSDIATKKRNLEKTYLITLGELIQKSIDLELCWRGRLDSCRKINLINNLIEYQ